MSTHSTTAVEQLLRRTYAEVSARTEVGDTPLFSDDGRAVARVTPLESAAARRRTPWFAAAAVLVLVVGGLVVLTGRQASAPAGRSAPRHVVPAWIPQVEGDSVSYLRFALTEINVADDVERLTWSTNAASISVTLDRVDASLPDGEAVEVGRTVASRNDDSLSWFGPGGALVTVSWSGAVDATMIDTFVDGLVYADDAMWSELTDHGGFLEDSYSPITSWRIDADPDFTIELVGNLHEGLALQVGSNGWALPIAECTWGWNDAVIEYPDDPGDPGRVGYVVLVPGVPDAVTVRASGEPDTVVRLTSLAPTLDVSVGTVVYDNRLLSSPGPDVGCNGDVS